MANASSLIGFADFSAALPLKEVADRLSKELFAGIQFSDEETGEWDEIPCLHLEWDFLGLRVVLGGDEREGYSLEVDTVLRVKFDAIDSKDDYVICDISEFLKGQIAMMSGFKIRDPESEVKNPD